MAKGFLYVIELDGVCVKIGRTKNAKSRMADYRHKKHEIGKLFITENMLKDASAGERKIVSDLNEYLFKGREYFSCSFEFALSILRKVYDEEEKQLYPEPGLVQRSIGLEYSLWKWIDGKAALEERTVSGQIRHELTKIKRELEAKK